MCILEQEQEPKFEPKDVQCVFNFLLYLGHVYIFSNNNESV